MHLAFRQNEESRADTSIAAADLLRELIDYKTSMIIDEDPLRGLLFYSDLGFSLTLHVLKERRRRCEHPHLREKGSWGFTV